MDEKLASLRCHLHFPDPRGAKPRSVRLSHGHLYHLLFISLSGFILITPISNHLYSYLSLQSFTVDRLSSDLLYFSFIIFQAFQSSNTKKYLLSPYVNDVNFLHLCCHRFNYFVNDVSWRPKGLSQEQSKDLKPFWRVSILSSQVRNVTIMLNFHTHMDNFCLFICQFTSKNQTFLCPMLSFFRQNFPCWAL